MSHDERNHRLRVHGATVLALVALGVTGTLWAGSPFSRPEPASTTSTTSGVEADVTPVPFEEAARIALTYLQNHRADRTGLVKSTEHWDVITVWDVGSLLAGVYAAGELGLVGPGETKAWLGKILGTLGEMSLYEGAVFNKAYRASDGRMATPNGEVSSRGHGWSVTDVGRLLIWLRIVEEGHPDLAEAVRSVVDRIDFGRLVENGYLMGETLGSGRYPEARVGYEQYAAAGFALWGHRAERSLDLHAHTEPVEVWGQTLLRDTRGDGKLTSEPLVLMGIELGWPEEIRTLSLALLAAQRARWEETGQVTVVSEDALQHPPYYFYYYTAGSDGGSFGVKAQGPMRGEGPRWVSSKAAYAWHALAPDDYTRVAVAAVAPAASPGGWASGVLEGTGRTTAVRNINTAGVILEAALYHDRGEPFLAGRNLAPQ